MVYTTLTANIAAYCKIDYSLAEYQPIIDSAIRRCLYDLTRRGVINGQTKTRVAIDLFYTNNTGIPIELPVDFVQETQVSYTPVGSHREWTLIENSKRVPPNPTDFLSSRSYKIVNLDQTISLVAANPSISLIPFGNIADGDILYLDYIALPLIDTDIYVDDTIAQMIQDHAIRSILIYQGKQDMFTNFTSLVQPTSQSQSESQ